MSFHWFCLRVLEHWKYSAFFIFPQSDLMFFQTIQVYKLHRLSKIKCFKARFLTTYRNVPQYLLPFKMTQCRGYSVKTESITHNSHFDSPTHEICNDTTKVSPCFFLSNIRAFINRTTSHHQPPPGLKDFNSMNGRQPDALT